MVAALNQVYSSPGGVPLHFDLFRPDSREPLPAIVCIHGGGWISGEKEGMHDVALRLAENGFIAACPDYRLAPLHPFPAAVQDVQRCVRSLRARADTYGILPHTVGAVGNSAGGHLRATLALTDAGPED